MSNRYPPTPSLGPSVTQAPPMVTNPALLQRIHILWDELADCVAARAEEARDRLLSGLCDLVGASNASWMGAVRLGEPEPGDPVLGWRPRLIYFLRATQPLNHGLREQIRDLEAGSADITTVRNVAFAGIFRTHLLAELAPAGWFQGDYYNRYYLGSDRADAIWAGVPINQDAEIYFGLFRGVAQSRFTPEDRDTVAYALRGLRWFYRQQMLGFGLLVAQSPLTQVERGVLKGLLAGLTEKQIAAAQGHSAHTTHEYVTRIFRKYGVSNRGALLSLWLGGPV